MSDDEKPVASIDAVVDAWWERALRGKPALDRIMYSASEAANHSRLWHALGAAQAVARRGHRPAAELSVSLLAEAVLVNGVIKTAFGRRRPVFSGESAPCSAPTHHQQLPQRSRQCSHGGGVAAVTPQPLGARVLRAGVGRGTEPHTRPDPPRQRCGGRDRDRRGTRCYRPPPVALRPENLLGPKLGSRRGT